MSKVIFAIEELLIDKDEVMESNYRPEFAEKIKLEEFRRKVRETTEKELVKDALRARKFSGISTLIQGMNLIDFALKAEKAAHEKD